MVRISLWGNGHNQLKKKGQKRRSGCLRLLVALRRGEPPKRTESEDRSEDINHEVPAHSGGRLARFD